MSEKKIVVPDVMMEAFAVAMQNRFGHVPGGCMVGLEAVLRWLSDNPIVPTDEDRKMFLKMGFGYSASDWSHYQARAYLENAGYAMVEWQKRMFLASEPEVPAELKDLLDPFDTDNRFQANISIIEAFRRGQKNAAK